MKHLTYIILFVCVNASNLLFGQNYAQADATIQLYPETFEDVALFDRYLSRDFNTDDEKVRAIYSWLIKNISYDPDAYKLFNYHFKDYRERNQKEERSRKKIIDYTLKTGKAVCEGYAMTFEKLLTLQGIENYLIQGDTKTHFKDIDRDFDLNHMWNAIKIDGTWHLFDATWGAGKYTDRFIAAPSYFYFKTDPVLFLKTHYPEDIKDAFVEDELDYNAFSRQPIYIDANLPLGFTDTSINGVINKSQVANDLEFQFLKTVSKIQYAYDGQLLSVKDIKEREGSINFTIPLQRDAKTLLIYCDDKPVLAYIIK